MRLVTVATYSLAHQAHMAKALLEGEGIPCRIAGEHLVGVYRQGLGGVDLQVPEPDQTEALRLLRDAGEIEAGEAGTVDGALSQPGAAAPLRRWVLLSTGVAAITFAVGWIESRLSLPKTAFDTPTPHWASYVLLCAGVLLLWLGLRQRASAEPRTTADASRG